MAAKQTFIQIRFEFEFHFYENMSGTVGDMFPDLTGFSRQ